jgi:hypothetical protein
VVYMGVVRKNSIVEFMRHLPIGTRDASRRGEEVDGLATADPSNAIVERFIPLTNFFPKSTHSLRMEGTERRDVLSQRRNSLA